MPAPTIICQVEVGTRWGEWEVVGPSKLEGKRWKSWHWFCKCSCGGEGWVSAKNLVNDQSRGCMKCKRARSINFECLTGKAFGNWNVGDRKGTDKTQTFTYDCICNVCGFETNINGSKLKLNYFPICLGCLPRIREDSVKNNIWRKIIWGARQRNLEFTVTPEYIFDLLEKQEYKCALTGLPISMAKTTKDQVRGRSTVSLDRINSDIGYVVGNLQWVHKKLNRMKQDFTQEVFIELCKLVVKHSNKKKQAKKSDGFFF